MLLDYWYALHYAWQMQYGDGQGFHEITGWRKRKKALKVEIEKKLDKIEVVYTTRVTKKEVNEIIKSVDKSDTYLEMLQEAMKRIQERIDYVKREINDEEALLTLI